MINVFRHPHFSYKAVGDKLKNAVKQCDAILLESGACDEHDMVEMAYNDLSFKGYSHIDITYGNDGVDQEFIEALKEVIRKSRKHIEIEKSPISFKEIRCYERMSNEAEKAFVGGRFEEAYRLRLNSTDMFLDINERRDEQLETQVLKMQDRMPDKTILMMLGGAHLMYYRLKKVGADVKQTLASSPIVLDNMSEYMRRKMLGMPWQPELIARTFSEDMVGRYLVKVDTEIGEVSRKIREVSDKLSLDDLKELSEYIGADMYRRTMPSTATHLWLRKRGIKL